MAHLGSNDSLRLPCSLLVKQGHASMTAVQTVRWGSIAGSRAAFVRRMYIW